jgi:beta-galactosidase
VQPFTAEVVASYDEAFYAGTPVVTSNRVGKGHVIYVGTFGDQPLVRGVVQWAGKLAKVECGPMTPDGVEAVSRWKENGQRLMFLLNHSDDVRSVVLGAPCRDLMSGGVLTDPIELAPKQVVIVSST